MVALEKGCWKEEKKETVPDRSGSIGGISGQCRGRDSRVLLLGPQSGGSGLLSAVASDDREKSLCSES